MLEGYIKLLRSMYSLTATARSGRTPDLQTAVLMLGGFQYMNLLTLIFMLSLCFGKNSPNVPRGVFLLALVVMYALNFFIATKNRQKVEEPLTGLATYSRRPAFIYGVVSTCLMACVIVAMAVKLAMR